MFATAHPYLSPSSEPVWRRGTWTVTSVFQVEGASVEAPTYFVECMVVEMPRTLIDSMLFHHFIAVLLSVLQGVSSCSLPCSYAFPLRACDIVERCETRCTGFLA